VVLRKQECERSNKRMRSYEECIREVVDIGPIEVQFQWNGGNSRQTGGLRWYGK